jgi:hypothetical protein
MAGVAMVALLPLIASLSFGETRQDVWLNVLLIMIGLLAGWVIGIVISPYGTREKEDFSVYTKAVTAFAGGYLVAKINDLVGAIFTTTFFSNNLAAFRFLVMLISTVGSVIITFYYRRYVVWEQWPEAKQKQNDKLQIADSRVSIDMTEPQVLQALDNPKNIIYNPPINVGGNYTITVNNISYEFRHGLLDDVKQVQ